MSDVCNIEFLDLSDVDENEKIRVRTTLKINDPSVELPWIKNDKTVTSNEIKQGKIESTQNDTNKSHTNHEYIVPTVSSAPYHNRDTQYHQNPPVIMPIIHGHPPSAVYYTNTLSPVSPPYPQQIYATSQNTINNAIHHYPSTTYPYTISNQPTTYPYPVSTQQVFVHNNIPTNSHISYPVITHQIQVQNNSVAKNQVSHIGIANPIQHRSYDNGVVLPSGAQTLQQAFTAAQNHSVHSINGHPSQSQTISEQPNKNYNIVASANANSKQVPQPSSVAVDKQTNDHTSPNGQTDPQKISSPMNNYNNVTSTVNTVAGEKLTQTSQPSSVTSNQDISLENSPTVSVPVVVQNGIGAQSEKQVAPSAGKSWASLFNPAKSNSNINSQVTEEVVEKVAVNKAVNEEANNENVCPIKHPRKSTFIDPDCYRMGEYLTGYNVDGRVVSLQPRGLINQSNYCYINSILQALIACPPMYNLLSGLLQNISSNEKRKPTPVIDGMCRFVKEFKQLPANMRVNNRRSEGKNQKKDQGVMINTDIPFEPSWIYKMLNGIRSDLIEGRQEDAEEFLGCLLNGLNDEMLELIKLINSGCDEPAPRAVNNVESENDADKEWQVMGPKNKGSITRRTDFGRTPISEIFGGFLKSKIHRAGDHVTENIQPFFTLQLNIEKVKTVREALEALVTKYQLEGLTSSKTNEEVEAWQQVMLDELPIILVLHLKCFDFRLNGCTKIIKALEFPIDLKIDTKLLSSKTQTAKEKQYKLFAVVYHDGKEATKGHYVTDAFHVGYSSWLRYDDASVKPVQEEQVLKPQGTRVPYLLFYRRSDSIRIK